MEVPDGGRALNGLGAPPGCQNQLNSEYRRVKSGSQTVGDNLHSREENNPYHQLRSQNMAQ